MLLVVGHARLVATTSPPPAGRVLRPACSYTAHHRAPAAAVRPPAWLNDTARTARGTRTLQPCSSRIERDGKKFRHFGLRARRSFVLWARADGRLIVICGKL